MRDKIRILLVEDEPIISDDLTLTLEEMGYAVLGNALSGEEAIDFLKKNKVDLALIDIMLEGDLDGVMVAQFINENIKIPFLYLTSLSDKVTIERVKHTSPSGYLLKPIDEKELAVNIELAVSNFYKDDDANNAEFAIEMFVRDKGRLQKIQTANILYLEASDNYCIIHTTEKQFVLSQTLKKVQLSFDPSMFCRIHKSFYVNIQKIDQIDGNAIRIGENQIPIGRAYKDDFFKRLEIL